MGKDDPCPAGGKHEWTTIETMDRGQHIKYTACKKCGGRP